MSPTENPIMPPPHVALSTEAGVTEWRPVVSALNVQHVGKERHIIVTEDGGEKFRFRLDADQARHIAGLLNS